MPRKPQRGCTYPGCPRLTDEIKTGLSRAKLSRLMDAETWLDAHKAVELGFADGIMWRADIPEDVEIPTVSMLYSETTVVNSIMDKIAAKCKTTPKKTEETNATECSKNTDAAKTAGELKKAEEPKATEEPNATIEPKTQGRSVDALMERLNLMKF